MISALLIALSWFTHAASLSVTLNIADGIVGWRDAEITVTTECPNRWSYQICRQAGTCGDWGTNAPGQGAEGWATGSSLTVPGAVEYPDDGTYQTTVRVQCGTALPYLATVQVDITAGNFEDYLVVDSAAALKAAVEAGTNEAIYLKPGTYSVNNPLVVNQNLLSIYGPGSGVRVFGTNENQPVFRVDGCQQVRLARFYAGPTNAAWQDEYALVQQSATPCNIELSQMTGTGYVMNGPGRLTSELSRLGDAANDGAYIADHPDAEVVILGGDISAHNDRDGTGNQWHIWIKRGWLSVWGLLTEGVPGTATFRIDDSTAGDPPHYIVGVRDEGQAAAGIFENRFVQVSGDARVALVANAASWSKVGDTPAFANATGTATLYLIGNECQGASDCTLLYDGTLTNVSITAIGNLINTNEAIPPALATYRAHNLYTSGSVALPITGESAGVEGFPLPEKVEAPHALEHPTMTAVAAAAFDWENVVADHGADPTGVADSTAAIQAALDVGCNPGVTTNLAPQVFIPAGTYKLTDPLRFDTATNPCYGKYDANGNTSLTVAGAGAATTRLFTTQAGEGMFVQEGTKMPYLADLTFDLVDATLTWNPATANWVSPPTYAGLAFDYVDDAQGAVFFGALLHRLKVSGGHAAIVFGHSDDANGSADGNACTFCELSDAGAGMASDHANAISNAPWDSTIRDVDYAYAHGLQFGTGGSASKGPLGFHVVMDGVRAAITTPHTVEPFAFVASDFSGDAPRFYPGIPGGATTRTTYVLHDSTLTVTPVPQADGSQWHYQHRNSGGLVTLDSSLYGADVKFPDYTGARFFAALRGAFSRYTYIALGTNSTKSKEGI